MKIDSVQKNAERSELRSRASQDIPSSQMAPSFSRVLPSSRDGCLPFQRMWHMFRSPALTYTRLEEETPTPPGSPRMSAPRGVQPQAAVVVPTDLPPEPQFVYLATWQQKQDALQYLQQLTQQQFDELKQTGTLSGFPPGARTMLEDAAEALWPRHKFTNVEL